MIIVDFGDGRKANRLPGYDYSRNGIYFVTTCVKEFYCVFGNVVRKRMIPNRIGHAVIMHWHWLAVEFAYVRLHEFTLMPNHFHGILEIDSELIFGSKDQEEANEIGKLKIKSLSDLIGAFKSKSSEEIHNLGNEEFSWQRSFHDVIIRNDQALKSISRYIRNNPANWKEDEWIQE